MKIEIRNKITMRLEYMINKNSLEEMIESYNRMILVEQDTYVIIMIK